MRRAKSFGWILAVLGLAWGITAYDAFAIGGRLACGSSIEIIGKAECPITITGFPLDSYYDEVSIFNSPDFPKEGPVVSFYPPTGTPTGFVSLRGDPEGPRERTLMMTVSTWGVLTTGPGCPPEGCWEGSQPGTYMTNIVIRHRYDGEIVSEVELPLTVIIKPQSADTRPVRATVKEVTGCVRYQNSLDGSWSQAVVGQQLRGGLIETCKFSGTDKEGNATLEFDDDTTVVLNTPWEQLKGLRASLEIKPSTDGSMLGRLIQGAIKLLFPSRPGNPTPRFEGGGGVIVAVKGTVFSLFFDPQTQQDTVRVEEGIVEVTPKNSALQPFTLEAGYEVQVGPDRVGPITPIAPTIEAPRITRLEAPAFVAINTYASYSLDFQDSDGDVSWMTVEKRMADGSWAFAGETSAGVMGQTQGTITGQVSCAEVGSVQARVILRDDAGHSSESWEFGFDCVYEQRVELEYALDANANGILDDAEIRQAIQYWILGQPVPGTDQIIDDATIRRLIQMWILGEPVSAASAGKAQCASWL